MPPLPNVSLFKPPNRSHAQQTIQPEKIPQSAFVDFDDRVRMTFLKPLFFELYSVCQCLLSVILDLCFLHMTH